MVTRQLHPGTTRLGTQRTELLGRVASRSEELSDVEREAILARLRIIARMFDDAVRVPGTKIAFGWDSVLGLIPVVGDAATTMVSSYFLWEAYRLGASRWTLTKMVGNVLTDFVVGTVPLVGDLVDVAWRANRRNMKLLEKELNRPRKK